MVHFTYQVDGSWRIACRPDVDVERMRGIFPPTDCQRSNVREAVSCPSCRATIRWKDINTDSESNVEKKTKIPVSGGKVSVQRAADGVYFQVGNVADIRPAHIYAWMRLGERRRIMEIGVQYGRNARNMILALNPEVITLVDPWVDFSNDYGERYHRINYEECQRNLKEYHEVTEFVKESSDCLDRFKPDTYDYIYIDGDHRYEQCRKDILNAIRLVKVGGIVGGHDYGCPPQVVGNIEGNHAVPGAVHDVLSGYFVDALVSDWWIVVTPDTKHIVWDNGPNG